VTGAFLSAVAVILVAGTALALAATLRLHDLPRFILGAYVLGLAEVVGLILLLSAFGAVMRPAILVAVALVFAASVAGWILLGSPRPPPLRLGRLRALRCDPALLVLAVATGLALLYILALIVGTPPTNWDSLTYHLTRAAFWSQANEVGSVANAYDERLNANPPNAEIALTFLLEVGRNERLAGFVQFASALAIAVGVYALARRLSLSRSEAAFGALVFLTLPIVILQASTAQNDLVAASLLMAAAVFIFGDSRREVVLAALATALAIGTKIPAAYGLPLLGALALVAPPKTYRMQRIAAVFVGGAAGSYWYVVNIVRTGHPLGDLSEKTDETGVVALFEPTENFFAAYARVLDSLDLSGAIGADVFVYVLIALVVAVVLPLAAHHHRRREVVPAFATGAVIIMPLAFLPVGYVLWRVFAKLHDLLEEPDRRLPVRGWEPETAASDSLSWFGPVGLLFVVGVGAAAAILVRRRSLSPLALVLAGAPLVSFALISISLAYDEWQGRFFMFPVALSASLWGVVLRIRRYAVATVAIAATTAALSLVHFVEKPSGVALLEPDVSPSIWGHERWDVQSRLRPEMRSVLRFLEKEVPEDGVLSLAAAADDFIFPAFGPNLTRKVSLAPMESQELNEVEAQWLLVSPDRSLAVDRTCWRLVHGAKEAWRVFRRTSCLP